MLITAVQLRSMLGKSVLEMKVRLLNSRFIETCAPFLFRSKATDKANSSQILCRTAFGIKEDRTHWYAIRRNTTATW